jgi:hypothetical protein
MAADSAERTPCAVYTRLAGSVRALDSAEHPGALAEHRERRPFREPPDLRGPAHWRRFRPGDPPPQNDEDSE